MLFDTVPNTPRLVNHFSLGADPEFAFVNELNKYCHAESFGMTTMEAFGCDMCGRMAELRAYPSKFALNVVASLIDTLRWLSIAHPDTNRVNWLALSFVERDGCGGHLHFGRKRDIKKDAGILDETLKLLLNTKTLDYQQFQYRKSGTKYGQYGDIRPQTHGFEYRTMPTWLSNPWLAYLVLVVNKLILHQGRPSNYSPLQPQAAIEELLQSFKGLDDDAAIAYEAYKNYGLPKQTLHNFRTEWGVSCVNNPVDVSRFFFPSIIAPEERTRRELFDHLTKRIPLPQRIPSPTWEPFQIPAGFTRVVVQSHTLGHLPDIGTDLISRVPVNIILGQPFEIISSIQLPERRIREALSRNVGFIEFDRVQDGGIVIKVPKSFNDNLEQCKALHSVLADTTLFPVCHYKKFHEADWNQWIASPEPAERKLLGRKLN